MAIRNLKRNDGLGIRNNGKTSFPTQTDIKISQILQLSGQEITATNATARWPIHRSNWLYWQGGIGTLYRINLAGNFAPNKIAWASIAKTGGHWIFGAPTVDNDDSDYLRSKLNSSN